MLYEVITKCRVLHANCETFSLNWCYSTGDYDMREFGEELMDIFKIPVNLQEREVTD